MLLEEISALEKEINRLKEVKAFNREYRKIVGFPSIFIKRKLSKLEYYQNLVNVAENGKENFICAHICIVQNHVKRWTYSYINYEKELRES